MKKRGEDGFFLWNLKYLYCHQGVTKLRKRRDYQNNKPSPAPLIFNTFNINNMAPITRSKLHQTRYHLDEPDTVKKTRFFNAFDANLPTNRRHRSHAAKISILLQHQNGYENAEKLALPRIGEVAGPL